MDQSNKVSRTTEDEDWELIVAADNGIDLLQYVFNVESFAAAAAAGNEIAVIMSHHDSAEEIRWTQVSLRAWRVEVQVSTPTGCWFSPAQQAFAAEIRNRFHQHHREKSVSGTT